MAIDFQEDVSSGIDFLADDEATPDISSIRGTPLFQPSQFGGGTSVTQPSSEGDFITSVASDPWGFVKSLPGSALNVAGGVGDIARGSAADLVSKTFGQPEYGGNIAAMSSGGDRLPVDAFLGDVAQTNPRFATVGKVGQGVARMAPMAAVGALPSMAQRLAALGFSAQMISDAPELAEQLGDELGKPPDQRDLDRLTTLTSDAIQLGLFAPAAGYAGVRNVPITRGDVNRLGAREIASQLKRADVGKVEAEAPLQWVQREPGVWYPQEPANAPITRTAVPVPPNPFFNPGVPEIVARALREAQGRDILLPGQEPALQTLRREFAPSRIDVPISAPKAEPLGGQISFAAPAEAGAVPSARQARISDIPRESVSVEPIQPITGPNARSYRRPRPAPTPRESELRQMRENVELGLEGPATEYTGSIEVPYSKEAIYPPEGPPTGTLSKLQRQRILKGKDVRSNVTNNPPMEPPATGIIPDSAVKWADETIQRGKSLGIQPVSTPELMAAYAVKGARLVENGIRDFAEWSKEMIAQHGPEVSQHLKDIWERSKSPAIAAIESNPIAEWGKYVKENAAGKGQTDFSYRFAEQNPGLTVEELMAAKKRAMEASKAAGYPDQGMRNQFFSEAAKWRQALDEAGKLENPTLPQLAEIEQRIGVGDGGPNAGKELMASINKGKPLNPGGALKDLPPELQAKSNSVKDAMRAEFEALKAKQKKQISPKEWDELTTPTVENSLRDEGVTVANIQSLLDGSKTPEQVVSEQLGIKKSGGSIEADTMIVLENSDGSRSIGFEPKAGPASTTPVNIGQMSHVDAIQLAMDQGVERIKQALSRRKSDPVLEGVTSLDPASGTPLSATDALINKLEALRFDKDIPQRYFSLPHPEIFKSYGKAIWNTGIDAAILSVKAGKTIAEAVESAWTRMRDYAKERGMQIDEAQVRANLENVIRVETAENRATPGTTSETVRMRNLSERGTTAETVPSQVQKEIGAAPESFYRQQSMAKVENAVKSMSDSDLASVPKDSDIYTAAKLELSNRLFDQGKNEAGYNTFQELSQELTRLGQVINQAKLLNAMRPEHVVTIVNESLKKSGRDPLTPEQSGRLGELSKTRIETQRGLEKSTDEWTRNPTDANATKAEKALQDSNRAALEEQRMIHKFQNRSMASLLKAILQGNLLTPISQVANVIGNMSFLPFRGSVRGIASVIDIIDSSIRDRPREVSSASPSGVKATAEGLVKGIKEIPDILMRGTGDVIKGEQRASLHPLRAWVTQFAKNPDAPTVGGKIPFSDRVKLAIEGTLGFPAEVMLRGLGAGDIAFREAARARLIAEQSRLKGVPESQRSMAQRFPEIFFDKETISLIENETRGAIFQRHSPTIDHLMSWMKSKGDIFDLAVSTIAPYKLTPWNIISEILSYNPLVAMAKTGMEAKRGNIRSAEMNAAKVIVGATLASAGWWLYQKGLLAPSMDSRSEQQKARILAGEVLPPNHINISGLKRALSGGDATFQPGDETRDIFRAGGLAGSMFYMMANIGRDMETKPETDDALVSLLRNSTLEQARFGMNQSFLKGVMGVLDAVREGNADTYLQSYANTILSVPLPNTLSALSRAEREYKVDTRADKMTDQLANAVKTRIGFTGTDNKLPLKRGLWGEPLRETPKDANALIHHFFDITKGRQVTDDPVPLELYRLWRKTADASIIPSPPGKTLTLDKQTYVLTPEQQSRYSELVGTIRRQIMDRIVINPEWHKKSDEQKIYILKRVYDYGMDKGKWSFLMESRKSLERKRDKAGF